MLKRSRPAPPHADWFLTDLRALPPHEVFAPTFDTPQVPILCRPALGGAAAGRAPRAAAAAAAGRHSRVRLPTTLSSAATTASTAFTGDHTHRHSATILIFPPPAPTAPTPLVQVRRPGGDARRDEALGQPETGVRLRDGHGHLLCVGLRALSQDCATAPSGHRPLPCGTPPNTVPPSDGRCSTLCRCSSRS